MAQEESTGTNGLAEEILDLVSRGKPKDRDNGSRVTAHDLFGSSSDEDSSSAAEEIVPAYQKRRESPVGSRKNVASFAEHSDGYDDDLYGDREDRERLMAMTEIDREAVLYERAQARMARAERKELERKVRDMELQEQRMRTQRAPSAAAEKKRQGLDALKAARDKKKRRKGSSAGRHSDDSDYVGSDQEEGEVLDVLYDEEDKDEDEVQVKTKSSKKKKAASTEPISFDLVNKNRLSRNQIVQWIYHPDFDDLAKGSFVRLSLGNDPKGLPVYRLTEIKKIVSYYRTYKIGNVSVNKGAILKYGKSEKTFRLDVISNSEFSEAEYRRWLMTLENEGQSVPSQKAALAKAEAWAAFLAQPVSDDIVQAMVEAKREVGNAHRNLIAERTHLKNQLEEAQAAGNLEECDQINTELASLAVEIEQSQANRQGSSRLEALAEINRRNRQLNVSIAREAEKLSATQKDSTTAGRMDPFSRRKCQPSNFHEIDDSTSVQPQEKQKNEQPSSVPTPTSTPKPVKKVDLFDVHDVDIDIDI